MKRVGSDTTNYLVSSCANCGVMNIVPRYRQDGNRCADCGSGPLIPLGYGILTDNNRNAQGIEVSIAVDTRQADAALTRIEEKIDRLTKKSQGLIDMITIAGENLENDGAEN